MNKSDFISAVAEDSGLSKADAGKAVDSVFGVISDQLKQGTEIKLPGFGSFSVKERAASMGRNPRTGEAIEIPAAKLPKFTAGKSLKDAVAG